MATIATQAAEVRGFWDKALTPVVRRSKEGASQTFIAGRFLEDINTGFLQGNSADNNADQVGIAVRAGQNGAAAGDKVSEYVPIAPGLLLEMNFLAAADAARVLAQTDLWVGYQYQNTLTAVVNTIDATTTTPRVFMVQIELDPGSVKGVIGDSNARSWVVPTGSLCATSPDV